MDLPGFGASDSFSNASASAVLGALTSFILAKQSGRPTILVTHDWGGVIGARLASEVGVLFTRCIILNAIHVLSLASPSASTPLRPSNGTIHLFECPFFRLQMLTLFFFFTWSAIMDSLQSRLQIPAVRRHLPQGCSRIISVTPSTSLFCYPPSEP